MILVDDELEKKKRKKREKKSERSEQSVEPLNCWHKRRGMVVAEEALATLSATTR